MDDEEGSLHTKQPSPDEAAVPPELSPSSEPAERTWALSPKKVAVTAGAVAVAALSTLAVVAALSDADGLATIALVLAILAFIIQLLVFVIQEQAATNQRIHSEQLNTETRALLSEVGATAQSTQALIGQQFNQLLQAFVRGAEQTAEDTKFDPKAFERTLLDNVRAAVQPPAAPPPQQVARESRAPVPAPEAAQQLAADRRRRQAEAARRRQADNRSPRLKVFPSEDEASEAVGILGQLSPEFRTRLQRLGEDELNSRENGTYVGLRGRDDDTELERHGLTDKARVRTEDGSSIVTRLSDKGVEVARLLTASGTIPSWAEPVISVESPLRPGASDDDIPF